MRKSVVTAMSGVSLVVVGLSWRGSAIVPAHVAAAGVVTSGVVRAAPSPSATRAPAPVARRSPAAVVRSPAAVRRAPVVHHTVKPSPTKAPVSPTPRRTASSVTVNGDAVDTRYGPVQVQITVRSGRITAADAIVYPQGSQTDRQYNNCAVPQLDDETLQAQSAQIDTVCGASYTSEGYRQSLQSAIDAAHSAGAL